MTPSATADGRTSTWTRDTIIAALQEYVAQYGSITQACLNPSTAKWGDRQDLVARYYAGRDDGTPWPSLNAVKRHLGKWVDAMVAADLPVNKPGPRVGSRSRAAGSVAPIRDVRVERVYIMSDRDRELSDKLAAARARADQRAAENATLRERVRELQSRPRATIPRVEPQVRTETKTITKTRTEQVKVADPRVVKRLEKAEAKIADLKAELKAAQTATAVEVKARAKVEVQRAAARQELAAALEELRDARSEAQVALARSSTPTTTGSPRYRRVVSGWRLSCVRRAPPARRWLRRSPSATLWLRRTAVPTRLSFVLPALSASRPSTVLPSPVSGVA